MTRRRFFCALAASAVAAGAALPIGMKRPDVGGDLFIQMAGPDPATFAEWSRYLEWQRRVLAEVTGIPETYFA